MLSSDVLVKNLMSNFKDSKEVIKPDKAARLYAAAYIEYVKTGIIISPATGAPIPLIGITDAQIPARQSLESNLIAGFMAGKIESLYASLTTGLQAFWVAFIVPGMLSPALARPLTLAEFNSAFITAEDGMEAFFNRLAKILDVYTKTVIFSMASASGAPIPTNIL